MDPSRVIVLGNPVTGFDNGDIFSNTNLNEYDAVILELSALDSELSAYPIRQKIESSFGRPLEIRINNAFDRLEAWAKNGRVLIAITTRPLWFRYDYGGASHTFNLSRLSIFRGIDFENVAGRRVEFCGPRALASLIANINDLQYQAVLKSQDMAPLLRVSKGKYGEVQIVGGYRNVGGGLLVVAPDLKDDASDDIRSFEYFCSLLSISDTLRTQGDYLPAWTSNYCLPAEYQALLNVAASKKEITILEDKIALENALIQSLEPLKRLFAETGEAFVEAVVGALRELGLKVVRGPHPRADLLAFDGRTIAAIECKGIEGCAREINLRQTEKWVSDVRAALAATPEDYNDDSDIAAYAECLQELEIDAGARDGLECKGLAVIGTYRKLPLAERGEDFPDPVARPFNRSDVCALTGLQLLGLLLTARNHPETKAGLVLELLSTNGVFGTAKDWKEFLIVPETTAI